MNTHQKTLEHWCFRLDIPPDTYNLFPATQLAWSTRERGRLVVGVHVSV